MNNTTNATPPVKVSAKMFSIRIGKTFSNISIFFLILSLCAVLSFVSTAFVFIIGFCMIIFSIGTVFVLIPNFGQKFLSIIDISTKVSSFFLQYWYIFIILTLLFAILSLVLLALDKSNKHVARITISSIVIGIAIITMLTLIIGV